jgi:predicted nuclease of predicted toxin-antitoxin system
MLRLFFDHDFNHRILRGLIQKIPDLDFVTPNQLGNIAETDANHLSWASKNRRVVVSHDVNTKPPMKK